VGTGWNSSGCRRQHLDGDQDANITCLVRSDGFVRLGPDSRLTQLFELTSDPYQEHDVIKQYPEVA